MPTTADHLLKLGRAHDHLEALEAEIKWWAAAHPYRILSERDEESDFVVLSAEPTGEPPLQFGVIAGDVLHNLRSCLDMLVLALAEASSGARLSAEAEKKSQFPICDTPEFFADQCRRGRLRFVDERPRAVIERLQPFHRGDAEAALWDPLALLRDLSDFDKHRRLPVMALYAHVTSADVLAAKWDVSDLDFSFQGRLEAKTEFGRYRGEEVEMDLRLALNVAFADAGPKTAAGRLLAHHLDELWRHVAEKVITPLGTYLPDTPVAVVPRLEAFTPTRLTIRKADKP